MSKETPMKDFNAQAPASGGTSLDIGEVMRLLARRRWLLAIPWAVALAAGLAGAFLLKPVYMSSVTLMLERPQVSRRRVRGRICKRVREVDDRLRGDGRHAQLGVGGAILGRLIKIDDLLRCRGCRRGRFGSSRGRRTDNEIRLQSFLSFVLGRPGRSILGIDRQGDGIVG